MNRQLVYTFSNILQSSLPFLLIPFLAKNLTVEGYGTIGLFQSVAGLFITLFGLGSVSLLIREYVSKYDKYTILITASFIITIVNSLLMIFVCYFFKSSLVELLSIDIFIVYLAVSYSIPIIFINITLVQLHLKDDVVKYVVIQLSHSVLTVLLSVLLVEFTSLDYLGRIIGMIMGAASISVISLFILIKFKLICFGKVQDIKNEIRYILKYGCPLLPHIIISFFIGSLDKFYINSQYTSLILGSYMISFQISNIINVVSLSISKIYQPWFFNQLHNGTKITELRVYLFLGLLFILLFLLNLTLQDFYNYGITFLAGDKYSDVGLLIQLMVVGQLLGGLYQLLMAKLLFLKKTSILSKISIFTLIFYMSMLYFLPEHYGVIGVILSFLFTWIFRIVLVFYNIMPIGIEGLKNGKRSSSI
ncbi:MAG: O-antigen/teichoic acid export membrane protein [Colwellia sp.]